MGAMGLKAERERIRRRLLERAAAIRKHGALGGVAEELEAQAGQLLADASLPPAPPTTAPVEVVERLAEALEKAQGDINWMLNEQRFLNGHVFDYIEERLAEAAPYRKEPTT